MPIAHQRLPVEAGELPLTIARAGGAGAAVVIVPSAFGVGPDLEAQMEELATDASIVVAIDPFFRGDGGPAPYDDRPRAMARIHEIDRQRAYRDLRAAIDWVRDEHRVPSVLLVGICFGGWFALHAAADRAVDGVITWHGSRMETCLERAADVRCTMRLHFGSDDPIVPPEALDAIRRAFADRSDVRIVVHDGATHGFSHRGAQRAYHPDAERSGMDSVRELIARARR
jgi:carboxymethylenebutenolidase